MIKENQRKVFNRKRKSYVLKRFCTVIEALTGTAESDPAKQWNKALPGKKNETLCHHLYRAIVSMHTAKALESS